MYGADLRARKRIVRKKYTKKSKLRRHQQCGTVGVHDIGEESVSGATVAENPRKHATYDETVACTQ